VAERVPDWLEMILPPQVSEIKGEMRAINARIDGEFKTVHSEMRRTEKKIAGVDKRLAEKLTAWTSGWMSCSGSRS
jgi:hypothetical protein